MSGLWSAVALALMSGLPCMAQATRSAGLPVDLQYQNRGDRFEGIRPKPVSGYDVELISALVDFREPAESTPQQFRLRFFLEKMQEVHLTVRELDYREYYWLDKVTPKVHWRTGFENTFSWPTGDVIRQLNRINMHDLGVVARLDKSMPSMVESVAPVIFHHSKLPARVDGYLFTFKVNADARLSGSFYPDAKAEPLSTETIRKQRGGRPFTIRWDSSRAEPGYYRLVLKGFILESNDPISQTVLFYHQPKVQR